MTTNGRKRSARSRPMGAAVFCAIYPCSSKLSAMPPKRRRTPLLSPVNHHPPRSPPRLSPHVPTLRLLTATPSPRFLFAEKLYDAKYSRTQERIARCHHHGRQRTLGHRARPATIR